MISNNNHKETTQKCWSCGKSPKSVKHSYETGGEKKINTMVYGQLFKCKYCGHYFCEEHRLPENHQCSGLLLKMNIRNKDGHLEYAYSNLLKSDIYTNQNIKGRVKTSRRRNYPINSKSDEARISYSTSSPHIPIRKKNNSGHEITFIQKLKMKITSIYNYLKAIL